ncbi:hypothetical protein ACFL6W_05855 [Thermodesulfobacteriota bacterium]
MEIQSKKNLISYCVLVGVVIIVHYVIVLNPDISMQPGQRAIFSWPAIGFLGSLGLLSVILLNLTKLKGLWDTDVSIEQKLIYPLIIGLLSGSIQVVYDLITGLSALDAANMGVESLNVVFPYSVPFYFGGAIITNILYYLILIPIVVFLFSTKLLKGKSEGIVFWSIGILVALIEPLTNPGINYITQHGAIGIPVLLFVLFFNLLSVWFIRKYGFISAIFLRIGGYTVWHILYGLFLI